MLTLQALKQWGADTDEGMQRCLNNEAFYLRMVGKMKGDTRVLDLEEAVSRKDWKTAFEHAHALKGVLANLALTPALRPVSEITECLRASEDRDYSELLLAARREMDQLQAIIG